MRQFALPVLALALALAAPVALAAPAAAAATCGGQRATIVGTSGHDVLTGTGGRDVIAALGGDDLVLGRGGNDILCGGYGADRVYGESGADRIIGGPDRLATTDEGTTERTGDILRGGPGDDRFFPVLDTRPADEVNRDTIEWVTATQRVVVDLAAGVATGQGYDTFDATRIAVVGSRYGDRFEGSAGNDRINAGPGSDIVNGHRGADRIVADGSLAGTTGTSDRVTGGYGDDSLSASWGADELTGGPGSDVIADEGATPDILRGGTGADLVVDILADTTRPQTLLGGDGYDKLALFANGITATPRSGTWNMATGEMVFTAGGHPIIVTAAGFEEGDLSTFGSSWTVTGSAGADTILGGSLTSIDFTALAGDDTMLGSFGDDVFSGGSGTDRSLGMGAGDDTCISVEIFDTADCEHVSA